MIYDFGVDVYQAYIYVKIIYMIIMQLPQKHTYTEMQVLNNSKTCRDLQLAVHMKRNLSSPSEILHFNGQSICL
jgi:hypothetical protein